MNTNNRHLGRWILLGLAGGIAVSLLRRRRHYLDSFRNRSVVIVGGSRGLGLVMARKLADEGARITLLARPESELEPAAQELSNRGTEVLTVPCDIRKREQVEQAIHRVIERFGRIDVLINNAGIIQVGPLEHMTVADFEDAMAVHLFGPLYTIMAALPYMRGAGGGRIVNISSIGGRVAVPHLLPYVTSKFALAGLSEGLGTELRRHNIFVTTVYPSLMRTGSPPNARFKGRHKQEYAWFAITGSLPLLSMAAERAAQRIIEACRRGSPRLALGLQTKAAFVANELMPGVTARLLALMNQLLPSPEPGGGAESYSGWESRSFAAPSALTRLSDQATAANNERPVVGVR